MHGNTCYFMVVHILSSFRGIGFNTANPALSTGKDYPVHILMMNRIHSHSNIYLREQERTITKYAGWKKGPISLCSMTLENIRSAPRPLCIDYIAH